MKLCRLVASQRCALGGVETEGGEPRWAGVTFLDAGVTPTLEAVSLEVDDARETLSQLCSPD